MKDCESDNNIIIHIKTVCKTVSYMYVVFNVVNDSTTVTLTNGNLCGVIGR
eukprot:m.164449 g.164449  ORF g.164449 m.164449 type:complete len:51 (-) comp31340_c2_seq3:168-320(-)